MPPYLHVLDDATADSHRQRHHAGDGLSTTTPLPKQNQSFLSILLKPLIMILITTLFFLFLGFAAFVFLYLCLAGALFHRRRIHQTHQLAPPPPPPNGALSLNDLLMLPKYKHSSNGAASEEGSLCAVCLENFQQDQCCRKLSGCGHVFHLSCVDTWLVKVAACPVCRNRVRADLEFTGSRLACHHGGDKRSRAFSD